MRKTKFFAALCCTAMLFAACEKSEPTNNSSKDPIDQDQEQEQEDGDTSVLTGTENGHDWVDLGLPSGLKWATCNIGATKPEDYGNYYAWGETTPKDDYSWETYKFGTYNYDTDYSKLTKYNETDGKTILEAADDAATQNWGSNWRMPTDDEWKELLEKCTWTWTTLNGVDGYEVKATNGNSIFLPAAGFRYDGELGSAGSTGNYWSSSLNAGGPGGAQVGYFNSDYHSTYGSNRIYGLSVRPVQGVKSKSEETITTSYNISVTGTENGTVTPSATTASAGETVTLTITPNSGYVLESLSVMQGGSEVTVTDNSFVMPEGDVEISAIFAIAIGTENGYTWVDLGLSVRWATMNVGAKKTEEYGNYYAWGEIATKSTYDWSNYTLADGSESTLTKYCCNSSYGKDGFTDELTTLTAADDAATQNWGGNWRMPTIDEWDELLKNCDWTWTTLNGVNGYEVKSTNGNSIFLPAAGQRDYVGELYGAGSYGNYWSSSLITDGPFNARCLYFFYYRYAGGNYRYYGQSVRPVCEK